MKKKKELEQLQYNRKQFFCNKKQPDRAVFYKHYLIFTLNVIKIIHLV